MTTSQSKLPSCVIGKVMDDEFNKSTGDRHQLINSYCYIPIHLLNTDIANIVKDALFKVKTTDLGMKKSFVIHCVIYDDFISYQMPKFFLVIIYFF